MSTHCNIALLLREEDRCKTFEAAFNSDYTVNPEGAKYLSIYVHNDGGPYYMKDALAEMANTSSYEDILNFILNGDRSSIGLSYHDWRDEPWRQIKPCPMFTEDDVNQCDYLYRFIECPNGTMKAEIFDERTGDWLDIYSYFMMYFYQLTY